MVPFHLPKSLPPSINNNMPLIWVPSNVIKFSHIQKYIHVKFVGSFTFNSFYILLDPWCVSLRFLGETA